ncbi:MAG TPA: hypothetical protein PLL54_09220 [Dermatophilaceae bacterium]|nr:hypothetical protein [Dermatophilaceae bacterium]
MDMIPLALEGAWKVLAAGLVLGAGLPLLYAFAVKGMAMANGAGAILGETTKKPAGKVLMWVCLLVILLAASYGISFIIATGIGKTVTFDHVIPWFVDKKK